MCASKSRRTSGARGQCKLRLWSDQRWHTPAGDKRSSLTRRYTHTSEHDGSLAGVVRPEVQPFLVDDALRAGVGADQTMSLSLEMQDTFGVYGEETLECVIGRNRSEFDSGCLYGRTGLCAR